MLRGYFKDSNGRKWQIKGYDFQTYFELMVEYHDDDLDLDFTDESRSFHMLVKPTNIEYSGVKGEHDLHDEFSRMASILFYLKESCVKENEEGYYDIDYQESGFKSVVNYITDLGSISQKMGTMVKAQFKDELFLEEVGGIIKLPWIDEKYTLRYKNEFNKEIKKEYVSTSEGMFKDIDTIIKENPDKNYSYILHKDLYIVNKDNLEEVLDIFRNTNNPIAFDTETDGLLIDFKMRDKLVGMILSPNEDVGYYFPLRHLLVENLCDEEEIPEFLSTYFKDILENKKLIMQNGSFDCKVMLGEGIDCNLFFDTLLAFRLTLWNEDVSLRLGLKPLAKRFLGHDSLELDDLVYGGWNENLSFRDVPEELVRLYGCMDGVNTYALYNYIIRQNLLEYYNAKRTFSLECKFSRVVAYQEFYGHHVDVDHLPKIRKSLEDERDDLYNQMKEMIGGTDFNPASTKDLQGVLFKVLGLKPIKLTASGNPSTDKESLKVLAKKHSFPKLLLEYREIATQINNFMNKIDEIATPDGFMFSDVTQILNTGRVSCSSPNYQSFSPAVKKYITPRENHYYLDFDYSAVEYRIMSSMSKEEALIDKFFDPDTDIHSYQASRMFGVPLLYVTSQLRSQSKGVSFGLMYGMQAQSLGETIFGEESRENTAKAENLMKLFFKGQEKVKHFFDEAQANSYKQGWSDTYIGRRRYFDKKKYRPHKIMRMGANHRIQGTAADFFKMAMVNLYEMLKKNNWLGKVLIPFFVHDEAVLEIHNSVDPIILLKEVMKCTRIQVKGWCPLTNECGFGADWYVAKKGETPLPVQDIMIAQYGESGVPWWNGDIQMLVDYQVGEIHKWQLDRLVKFLRDPRNHNKEIDPPILKQGQALYKDFLKGDMRGITPKPLFDEKDFEFDTVTPLNNIKSLVKMLGMEDLYEKAGIVETKEPVEKKEEVPKEVEFKEDDISILDLVQMRGFYRKLNGTKEEFYVFYPEDWLETSVAMQVFYQLGKIMEDNKGNVDLIFITKQGELLEPEENGISKMGVIAMSKYISTVWRDFR